MMQISLLVHSLAFFLILFTNATPLKRDPTSTNDITILNRALWMELLLSALISDGLNNYTAQHFEEAGYPPWVRPRLTEIAQHDTVHAENLKAEIVSAGGDAMPICEYDFAYQEPRTFLEILLDTKSLTESTYLGSIAFLIHGPYLTRSASIATVEGRHASWLGSAVDKNEPWSSALDIPLTWRHACTPMSRYVSRCPEHAPIKCDPFPELIFSSTPIPGEPLLVDLSLVIRSIYTLPDQLWLAFITDGRIHYVPVRASDKGGHLYVVIVPKEVKGTVYVILTIDNKNLLASTIAGSSILRILHNPSSTEIVA